MEFESDFVIKNRIQPQIKRTADDHIKLVLWVNQEIRKHLSWRLMET